ncbi:Ankyrin repeat-containing protein [Phytophthora cinnamomi]|uniref:Ankyrin repeat-containing protein n=1 Tax=Phytophthora cinnamomi TaxID=4785 RepID=UPI003559B508|nr:Ankyrin repeat-containing protein [Phytophthora cinnamomi]
MAADSAPVVNEVTERLVVRLQTLYRARRARREAVELANSAYLKCWDAVSGLAYYCNLRTGLSSWKKPLLLAARDPIANPADDSAKIPEITFEATNDPIPDPVAQLSSKDRQKRHEEGLAFKEKCAQEKRELMLRHRRKIARAMRRFEKNMLDEKTRNRQERQARLKNDNQQLLQDLYHGNKKENVQTIREAALQGNLDRIEKLLDMGFSADAESAMGLTPLLAACQSGHLEVVRRLLSSGASVNHAHIKTGRTALMEAASCAKPPVLKELLRYGARIYAEDVQGETVFDCMKDAANREVIAHPAQPQVVKKKKTSKKKKIARTKSKFLMALNVPPTALRPPPDQLPEELEEQFTSFQQSIKELCDQLQAATGSEHFDTANGISRDSSGASLATLDIFVEQAENLPYRDPRICDMIDPFVRVFLRSSSVLQSTEVFKTEMRIGDRNPVWEFRCQITAVPSTQKELCIQVVDTKREDVAGEITVPLRSLLDQKDHYDWYVIPPTLRQQILEKKPRDQPARIRVCVKLTHTKSIVLTRELQQMLKTREVLVKKRRDAIQDTFNTRLQQLP